MSAAAEYRHEPFYDERLTRSQNKAVEMQRNGFSRAEIADEMQVGQPYLRKVYTMARKRGVEVPMLKRGGGTRAGIPIERLLHIREMLHANGITWGVNRIIAERVGLSTSCVKVRLWYHDRGGRP